MVRFIQKYWLTLGIATILVAMVLLIVRPYGWRVSALLHLDHGIASQGLPRGFVVLRVPGYDGAQYYQVARNIPKIITPSRWDELRNLPPLSYSYQRFLLPLTGYVLALGRPAALPWTLLGVNIACLLLVSMLFLRWKPRAHLYTLALCLSPASMVALHFSLAEPLTILLITTALIRLVKKEHTDPFTIACLSLAVITREVNVLFILFLLGLFTLRRKPKDCVMLLIPIGVFLAWHTLLYLIFGDIPFFTSTAARQLPGSAAIDLILGKSGWNRYTLSSIALFLGIVLPALFWTLDDIVRLRRLDILPLGTFAFLCLMLVMPAYIWGSITSIGRVITPVYPLLMMLAAEHDTFMARTLAIAVIGIGVATALGLALSLHPYTLAVS